MTDEPASKERMAPDLMFSSECMPQLSKTASNVQWPLRFAFSYVQLVTQRYRRKTVEVPLQQSSHHENRTIRVATTINHCLKSSAAITLCFQLCSTHCTALQMKNSVRIVSASVQSPQKIRTIPVYKRTVGKPCIALPQIDTLGCQQKEMRHKGESIMHALYILRYAKRHVSG